MSKVFNLLLASLVLLCLSQGLNAAAVKQTKQEEGVSVKVVKDIKIFNKTNPSLHLQELNRTVLHTFGERVYGDKLLFVMGDTHYYPLVGENTSQVTLPENSTIVITSVEVRLKGNADGNVYVADGGIGQNFISFVIEGPKSGQHFAVKTEVFGKE